VDFAPKLSRCPCPSCRCHAPISVTARRNGSLGGARGDQGEVARGLGQAGAPLEDALIVVELEEEGHPITHTAPVTVAAEDPLR
jgi:hypothetical protein